jgi:hypothetical protein
MGADLRLGRLHLDYDLTTRAGKELDRWVS